MSNLITVEEQERRGLREPARNFVTPWKSDDITTIEGQVIGSALSAASTVMSGRQMSHLAKTDDTALTITFSSLFYSLAYSIAGAMITAGILIIAYWLLGGDEGIYAMVFIVLWGCCFLGALAYNRWQGLHFSPAGLDHHEIDSRERIAKFAIEKHVELLEKRWKLKG